MKYFIKTFGCQQNVADSERIASVLENRGMQETKNMSHANYIVINTCMVRRSAEDRVYGMVQNLGKIKKNKLSRNIPYKIIVTGCLVGMAYRDKTGEYLNKIRSRMPEVDEFMPIEEVGFDNQPVRQDSINAWVPISNGCNNFCTFCIVPFTRGREISRSLEQVLKECRELKEKGYKTITLLGQNVNSYGADLLLGENNVQVMRDIDKTYFQTPSVILTHQRLKKDLGRQSKRPIIDGSRFFANAQNDSSSVKSTVKPTYVKHLGRYRIPTLFPYLLQEVANLGFQKVDFISSNPWDFSDELIETIAKCQNITRTIHLPVQSGDNTVLKRMNRWYTAEEYLKTVQKLKDRIPDIKFTTDIIVGFCGESEEEFENTVKLTKMVDFEKAYISIYSQRPMTAASKLFPDDVPHAVKKARWLLLDSLINRPGLRKRS